MSVLGLTKDGQEVPTTGEDDMGDLVIVIPTYGRVGKQRTLSRFPAQLRNNIILLIRKEETGLHHHNNTLVLPNAYSNGIGKARQFALEYFSRSKLLFLDDDLVFAEWKSAQKSYLTIPAEDDRHHEILAWVEYWLDNGLAHCTIGCRQMADKHAGVDKVAGRAMRAMAFDCPTLHKHKIRFDTIDLMCDYYATLSLLTKGYPNVICYQWVQDDMSRSNALGGCSTYRSAELQERTAKQLQAKFPDFVTVVQRKVGNGYWKGMQTRTDVRVSWKKAYQAGKARRDQ